jgi:carboxymethylenebutenolidase
MHATMVDVPTPDGVADVYLAHPDDGRTHPAVLFYMDGIGLRPRLFEMAERLAANGYVVLVPNVFYRQGRAPLLPDLPELLRPENRGALVDALSRPCVTPGRIWTTSPRRSRSPPDPLV